MNDRSLILKIIQHPLVREVMENELATSSIITRLIAEELYKEQQIDPKGTDNIKKLKDVVETARVHLDDINTYSQSEIEPNDLDEILPDIIGFIDILEEETKLPKPTEWPTKKQKITLVANQKNYNRASAELLYVLEKWVGTKQQPGAIRKISAEIQKLRQDSRPESQNQIPNLSKALQDYLKVYIDIIKFSAQILKLAEEPGDHPCILLLRKIIKQTGQDTGKKQSQFAFDSKEFIKIAQFGKNTDDGLEAILPGNVKTKISKAHEVYAESLQSNPDIEKFVELATKNTECKTQFKALKEKNTEEFVIGSFLILYKTFLEKIGRPEDEKPDKMLDAMKRTNKLATDQKDIYWSLDGGFTQVFEVAYLPEGSETANNGTEEKPLADYNISQENLKTGKKGSILIVRSEQLYKVEKIVQEQEEGKRITVSIPIDNVKQYNALFSGTEDEKGMPTGSGAFFVHSDQEKMVPLKAKAPEETPETEPEQIDLEEDAIKNYLDAFELFKTKFLNVKKLHTQSEIFRQFYMTIFPIAGINPDTIVGQQIDAYTQVARPDQKITADDVKIDDDPGKRDDLNEEEKEDKKNLTKNISQNAKVIERHANAILEILEEYERYLNIGGKGKGVEQGSRILLNKFGESDPKKLIRKFVQLIVKDINAAIKSSKEMIELSKKQLEPQGDKKEKEKEEPQQLTEAEVDNSVRELPTREKIILVIKTAKQVNQIGEKLKEMIAKIDRPGEEQAKKEAPPKTDPEKKEKEGEQTTQSPEEAAKEVGPAPGKRDDLREAPTMASDARINADPTGTDSGPRDLRKLKARGSDEISLGYKEEAKKIYELLTKIRPLFPTSQPFDTNYSFDVAMKAFKSALTGLSTNVAQVSGYEYDQLTDAPVLNSFITKIEAFKNVIKDIFGYTKEAEEAENQASFNEEGEGSGLPHPEPTKPGEGEGEKPEEDSEELQKLYTDESEFYKRMKERAAQLSAGETAEDFGFVPLQEEDKSPQQLIENLKKVKALIEKAEEEYDNKQRTAGTQETKKAKETLQKAIAKYISIYEEIGKKLTGKDPGSNVVRPDTKVKRIDTLVKSSVKFLEENKSTYEFFMGLIMDTPEDPKSSSYIKNIWKRMKKLDGQAPAITDARMKQAIRRAEINVKRIFDNRFPKANFNFTSFKTFVTRVADQISDVAIRIDNSLKEEEESSKEFDLYNKQVVQAFNMMKEFIGFYKALELAVQHLRKKDFAQTVFIKSFDKEYDTIVNLSRRSRMKLRAISTSFRGDKPSMSAAKKYGFPPAKTTSEPDPQDAGLDNALDKANAALKKTFKLEKLQQDSGMNDSQVNLYAKFLVELDKLKVVKLTEEEIDDDAFKNDIKNAIKKKFKGEEYDQLLQIINMKGVMQHLYSIYTREAVDVEGDTDDIETKPIIIDKDNVKLKLPPPPAEVVKKARRRKKVQDLLDRLQNTIEDSVGTRKVDVKKNIKTVTQDLVDEYTLEDQEKEKLVKYLLDTTGKVKDEELPSEEELRKTLDKQRSGEEIRYFKSNYKPGKNDIKFEVDSNLGKFMSAVIKFFKEDLNLQENIGDVKRNIPQNLKGILDGAIDKAEKLFGRKSFTEFSNFLSQTSTEKIPGGTISKSNRKQNNAAEVFANLLKRTAKIDLKTKKAAGREFIGGPSLDSMKENKIAIKLKPLIREMLNKGK